MTDTDPVHPSRIERYFEQGLSNTVKVNLPLLQDVLDDTPDRWYGQLVVTVSDSLSDRQDREEVLPAAAAIELLRGYVRLRSRLLVTPADKPAHSLTLDPTAELLAGDCLSSAAFSSLRTVPASSSGDCFETLTTVLETITEAFARPYNAAGSTEQDQAIYIDETAGTLGEGAAALGATLAGVDEPVRRHCERLGRGLSTARQINYVLDMDPTEAMVVPPTFDESQFRMQAERGRNDAAQAIDTLSEIVDVTRLRAFAEASTTRQDQ